MTPPDPATPAETCSPNVIGDEFYIRTTYKGDVVAFTVNLTEQRAREIRAYINRLIARATHE